jgi:alcohol dehydrogenase class IV
VTPGAQPGAPPRVLVYGPAAEDVSRALSTFGLAALPGEANGAEHPGAVDGTVPGVLAPGDSVRVSASPARLLTIARGDAPDRPPPDRPPLDRPPPDRPAPWRLVLDGAGADDLERPDRLYGVLEAAAAFLHAALADEDRATALLGPGGGAAERRTAHPRRTHLGSGALDALEELLAGSARPAAVVSPSLGEEARELMRAAAGRDLPMFERPPGQLTDVSVAHLSERLAACDADLVLGVGGGTVLDAAKATGLRAGRTVVLAPTTLSGAEQTGNAAIWAGGRKTVNRVGLAHAVTADPRLLAGDLDALGPTALHAVAHTLTILGDEAAEIPTLAAMASCAVADLLPALEDEDLSEAGRLRFLRGAWNAALSIGLTGPKFGPHHELVHRLVRADRPHARLSAALLCATLTRTSVHDAAMARIHVEGAAERLREVAAAWWPRLRPATLEVRPVELDSIPEEDRRTCETLLEALGAAPAAEPA